MAQSKTEKQQNKENARRSASILKLLTDSSFVKEFGEFIDRGNVVDLAIGVAVGGAFTTIVKSLVDDIIMPIASLLAGGADFSALAIDVPNIFGAETTAHIAYGNFIQNVVNFLVIAFTVFVIVRTLNRLNTKKVVQFEAEVKKAVKESEPKNQGKWVGD